MTSEALAKKLRKMYDHGLSEEKAMPMVILFGLMHCNDLESRGDYSISSIAKKAFPDRVAAGKAIFDTEIRHGKNIAEFVQLKPGVDF